MYFQLRFMCRLPFPEDVEGCSDQLKKFFQQFMDKCSEEEVGRKTEQPLCDCFPETLSKFTIKNINKTNI